MPVYRPCVAAHTPVVIAESWTAGSGMHQRMPSLIATLCSEGFADQILHVRYKATNLDDNYRTVTLYLTAMAGCFDIGLVRASGSDVYVGAFDEQLSRHGITFTQGAEERYVTPENGLITSLGLAQHASASSSAPRPRGLHLLSQYFRHLSGRTNL
ncbi:MAG: hypothetical protein IKG22_06515 [Atopobiaceae bacterium]|nr:hypothetical protein [Atopobiaceae bacterium]